jgi:hypothetical protein
MRGGTMAPVIVLGVDPGLVHTGVVLMQFHRAARELYVDSKAVLGADAPAVKMFLGAHRPAKVFIEAYRPRSHFDTDTDMAKAISDLKRELPDAVVLNNTGVKKVVRRPLMEAMGIWTFPTVTHHQDLRSAGRIGVLGMLKDEELNLLVSDFIRDWIDGKPWRVLIEP